MKIVQLTRFWKRLLGGTITLAVISLSAFGVTEFNNYNFFSKRPVKYYDSQAFSKVLPKKTLVAPKYNHHRGFVPTTFPSSIQGVYIANTPVRNKQLSKYYQITSLVRITRTDIYQQFSLTSKRLPMRKIATTTIGVQNKALQRRQMHRLIKEHIPSSARMIVRQNHLNNKIGNYNIDMSPGNIHQNGNTFYFDLKQQTMLSGYTSKKLKEIVGKKSLIVIPPKEFCKIRIHADVHSRNVSFNGKQFKKISDAKAMKLLHQDDIALFLLGY